MESALIITQSEKVEEIFREVLFQNKIFDIEVQSGGGKARRLLLQRQFDLCIIDAPLLDEFGDKLAKDIAQDFFCQVILLVKSQIADEVASKVEESGVFTLGKPLSKQLFWNALKMANASFQRFKILAKQNSELHTKIDDIKLVDKAKCLLIEKESMTEVQAHKTIEKSAMNDRRSKKEVAKEIIDRLTDF